MRRLPASSVLIRERNVIKFGFGLLLLLAGTLIYLPGLSGPFIFDDTYNIVINDYVHIRSLGLDSLFNAAFSTDTGPLKRPVSMLSFALNYYVAGGIHDPSPFKAVNIAIHAINGLLVYWLCYLIFTRLSALNQRDQLTNFANLRAIHVAAGASALLWVAHPIQLTSVLYVVQRMTSLSATFTLLGLIGYLTGRLRIENGKRRGIPLIILGILIGGTLASLSKEIGILLPLFVLMIEATIFRNATPWSRWQAVSNGRRRMLAVTLTLLGLAVAIWVVDYAAHGYARRPFTMVERALTEARVLWLYLSLIIAPGLDRFGLNHDDIPISSSLFDPWTTLPSLLGIIFLIVSGLMCRKRKPLLALGVLWFFIGHSLESTIFGLEIAHEHRNYLPSLGIILVGAHFVLKIAARHNRRQLWLILPVLALLFGGVTTLRSSQWSDIYTLATYEVRHHPDSPRAQGYLGQALAERGQFEGAALAYRRAAELDPSEPSYLMILQLIHPATGLSPTPSELKEIVRRLVAKTITPGALLTLHAMSNCILQQCAYVQKPVEEWIKVLLMAEIPEQDNSFYYHLLGRSLAGQGRTAEALDAFFQSYALDPRYLHPRIDAVKLLLGQGQLQRAQLEMSALIAANLNTRFPRDDEIAALSAIFDDLKQRQLLSD